MDVNTQGKKAIVLGGTGLIGGELIQQLIANDYYQEIHVIGRSKTQHKSPKIIFHQVDMNEVLQHSHLFNGDVVFCCLGTTIKTAGSQEAFIKVDHDMVVNSAKAAENKVGQFIMVSSLGANANSSNFYLRTKGKTEADVFATPIASISVMRPSMLFGNRVENRTGEKFGIVVMKIVGPVLIGGLKKYRGIEARDVAKAMIKLSLKPLPGHHVYESDKIQQISNEN